jgi:hypothetical protein
MGAGIALQSAGADPRIEAVVAEAPSPAFAKRRMTTQVCKSTHFSAKRFSRPVRG